MFFKRKNIESETYIDIEINEESTIISVIDNSIKKVVDKLSLNYGYFEIIDSAYNQAVSIDKSVTGITLDLFFDNHYDKIYPSIRNFISHIEFSILCKTKIPSKVEKIYVGGAGAPLFYKEFRRKFKNCYLKAT